MSTFQSHPSPRVYTVPELLQDLKWVMTHLRELWSIWVGSSAFPRAS